MRLISNTVIYEPTCAVKKDLGWESKGCLDRMFEILVHELVPSS